MYSLEDGKPFPILGPDMAREEDYMRSPNYLSDRSEEERLGTQSGRSSSASPQLSNTPKKFNGLIEVERRFIFTEDDVKKILADYVNQQFGNTEVVTSDDVKGDYRKASGDQYDYSLAYCKFTVTAKC